MKRALTILTCVALTISMFGTYGFGVSAAEGADGGAQAAAAEAVPTVDLSQDAALSDLTTYNEFLAAHADTPQPDAEVPVDITAFTGAEGNHRLITDYLDRPGTSLYTDETGYVEFTITVPEAGLYAVKMDFVAENSRGSAVEREFYINGEMQHAEMRQITFRRIYENDVNDMDKKADGTYAYRTDTKGNDIRPSQVEVKRWQSGYFRDQQGYILDAMLISLNAGVNTVRLTSVSEPLVIGSMTFCHAPVYPTYDEVAAQNAKYGPANAENIIIQGEDAAYKSDPVLYPRTDRTTPTTLPYERNLQKLNTVGGSSWAGAQQYLTWEVEIPADGLYSLYVKERQNTARGVTSSRMIKIDGEVPCAELAHYQFPFDNNWRIEPLGNGDTVFEFYLTKGTHSITMEASLGDMATRISKVQDILVELNNIYTTIMKVTGSEPDSMQNYALGSIPETKAAIDSIGPLAVQLEEIRDWFIEYSGKGKNDATLNTVIVQLNKMYNHYNDVPSELDYFKTNIGNLGTWLTDVASQPLEIDYLALVSDERQIKDLPAAKAGFFKQFGYEINQFFASFFNDYNSIGSSTDSSQAQTTLKVWVPTGRDQVQIIRKMVDTSFIPTHPYIGVTMELVAQASLLPATVAGIGPDVSLQQPDAEPVNFAVRDAAVDLTQFPDYEEIASRFLPERMTQLKYQDGVYALPETQLFNVLFYRSDVLADLGIGIPQTWDEVIAVIPLLLKNNMSFALPVSTTLLPQQGVDAYYAMLLQSGGEVYHDNGKSSALDTEIALSAFRQWTNMFLNYELPQTYDFKTRFRTGEYPLVVADFSNYNTLVVSAPEISGLWGFTLLPGTKKADGSIDRSTPISGVDTVIMNASKSQQEAWEFAKWWTSADAQYNYGVELESVMGASARYATANLEAFEQIPWNSEMYEILSQQMAWGRGIPQVPGSYYMPRNVNNAFRRVVISKDDAKETLFDYVYTINEELTSKRKEFGLDVEE